MPMHARWPRYFVSILVAALAPVAGCQIGPGRMKVAASHYSDAVRVAAHQEKQFYTALTDHRQFVGCTFRGYRVSASGAEAPIGRGDRAPGWAQLGTTTVGLRWFWQMYPKSITLSADGTIRLGLWPAEWAHPHVFEGHIHKTHELLFAFDDEPGAGAAEASFNRFNSRLLAVASFPSIESTLRPYFSRTFATAASRAPRASSRTRTRNSASVSPGFDVIFKAGIRYSRRGLSRYSHAFNCDGQRLRDLALIACAGTGPYRAGSGSGASRSGIAGSSSASAQGSVAESSPIGASTATSCHRSIPRDART